MRFIDKLERKYGRYGIENLTMYIIISYVLGYALMYINPGALSMLSLNVTKYSGTGMEVDHLDRISAKYIITSLVCDRDFIFLLSDQCFSGAYLGKI